MAATVRPLPDSVRNTMRSGVVLFDFTRVVEELIFNSLDAGSTKVSVYVGVGTNYVKVVDDGCGISRDGLVLLGERYVTSKFRHLSDGDAVKGSFGCRGEALASISDVSLLEIVSKAYGKPNGYRKVLKGSNCLFLGIDDDRKDVGTTVVVRDLFYNQPVRRKYMQSSPKKVLDSVKKCVFRISLVHSKVSFKVVDIESEDELLSTHPSSTLFLLMSGLGLEDSNSMHELSAGDGTLKLFGYVSGPCDSFGIQAFQYVYINSRFVSRGQIHKLLNDLASKFESWCRWKDNSLCQKGKKSRHQAYPAYIVNLCCPPALYDLNFEPSKTYVEFKDWVPILAFIERAIQQLWSGSINCAKSSIHVADMFQTDEIWKEDFSENSESTVKKFKKDHQSSSPLKPPTNEVNQILRPERDKVPLQDFEANISSLREQTCHMEFGCDDHSSWNSSLSSNTLKLTQKDGKNCWKYDYKILLPDHCYSEDSFPAKEASIKQPEGYLLGFEQQNGSLKIGSGVRNDYAENSKSLGCHNFGDELEVGKNRGKPFLQSCSVERSKLFDSSSSANMEEEFSIDGSHTKRRRVCDDEDIGVLKSVFSNKTYGFPSCSPGINLSTDFDRLSGSSLQSSLSHKYVFGGKKYLTSELVAHAESSGSGRHCSSSEWYSATSDASFEVMAWDAEHLPGKNSYEESGRLSEKTEYWGLPDRIEDSAVSSYTLSKRSALDNCLSSCAPNVLDFKGYIDSNKDECNFLQGHNRFDEYSFAASQVATAETELLLLNSQPKGHKSCEKFADGRNQLRYLVREQNRLPEERCRRSISAPPFYRLKRRFISLKYHSEKKEGNCNDQLFHNDGPSPETYDVALSTSLLGRPYKKNKADVVLDKEETKEGEKFECPHFLQAPDSPVGGSILKEGWESTDPGAKWRNGCQQIRNMKTSTTIVGQHDILDISSGFLHLAGISLIPESVHKNFLEDAKVLQQVDKKFIPVVSGGTLAVIDQHAADERIQLEELRQKVLSGEGRAVTYLDMEEEMMLPEMEYQLLQSYTEQIRDWGWICNIEAPGSASFKKNLKIIHQQPAAVTLLAVPCILGVDLSDGDLLEFLQQLADTDGSSTVPPSVLRILNFKACRGAIMFGDSLLPSECALIVEELKQTSLCFQCAHGRPTTVPLVNMEALHKQIARIGESSDGSRESWHGLHRCQLSVERAAQRLNVARGSSSPN